MEQTSIENKKSGIPTGKKNHYGGMTVEELMNVYSLMYSTRKIDEKIIKLLKQGKVYFHIASSGHEAVQTAFALAMKKKN